MLTEVQSLSLRWLVVLHDPEWLELGLGSSPPLFMGCRVIFSMLRLISDNPLLPATTGLVWPAVACCDIPAAEDDLKSDLLPLKRLVALANR